MSGYREVTIRDRDRERITTILIPVGPGGLPSVLIWGAKAYLRCGASDYRETTTYVVMGSGV